MALIGDPELLFLDEPTTGFDPGRAARGVGGHRARCSELGKTVFLTTHYMEEAQRLADRVAIVKDGRIVAAGPPDELAGDARRPRAIALHAAPDAELPRLSGRWRAGRGARHASSCARERVVDDLARADAAGRASAGIDLPGLDGHAPDARGRLPGADRRHDRRALRPVHQYRYDQRQFWREPASVFFTVVLPLIFFMLFAAIFGNDTTHRRTARRSRRATYYVPRDPRAGADQRDVREPHDLARRSQRERGQLKRVRATPVPGVGGDRRARR